MRRKTMSRFDTNIPENRPIANCVCCGEELYKGYDVVKFENEVFCNMICFTNYLDVRIEPIYV